MTEEKICAWTMFMEIEERNRTRIGMKNIFHMIPGLDLLSTSPPSKPCRGAHGKTHCWHLVVAPPIAASGFGTSTRAHVLIQSIPRVKSVASPGIRTTGNWYLGKRYCFNDLMVNDCFSRP